MNQDKKIQVVMLVTDKTASLCLAPDNKLYTYNDLPEGETYKGFELLFLSDDDIKEGDWVINQGDYDEDIVFKADAGFFETGLEAKKIIVSTNESLGHGDNLGLFIQLPQPSKEWIKFFVSEYNKGNIITEVMVEYEEVFTKNFEEYIHFTGAKGNYSTHGYKLKVNPDNTINIKSVEETWDDILNYAIENNMDLRDLITHLKEDYQVPKQLKK